MGRFCSKLPRAEPALSKEEAEESRLLQPESTLRLLFTGTILAAAIWDFRSRRIPNALTFGAMAIALASRCLGEGLAGLATWFLGLGAGAALLLLPCVAGGVGAGDLKLLAAAGSMLGPFQVLCAFLAAAIIGALLALATMSRIDPESGHDGVFSRHIPYGLPLAAGVLLSAAGAWL